LKKKSERKETKENEKKMKKYINIQILNCQTDKNQKIIKNKEIILNEQV